jgi:hypothetical protein
MRAASSLVTAACDGTGINAAKTASPIASIKAIRIR